jgi:hypothetical protein
MSTARIITRAIQRLFQDLELLIDRGLFEVGARSRAMALVYLKIRDHP